MIPRIEFLRRYVSEQGVSSLGERSRVWTFDVKYSSADAEPLLSTSSNVTTIVACHPLLTRLKRPRPA